MQHLFGFCNHQFYYLCLLLCRKKTHLKDHNGVLRLIYVQVNIKVSAYNFIADIIECGAHPDVQKKMVEE